MGRKQKTSATKSSTSKLSLKDKLDGLNILKEDLILLRICGVVGLVCASLISLDGISMLLGCRNEGCGTGVGVVLAALPTLLNTPIGAIAFVYIQMKLKKNPKNARTAYKIKQINKESWILLLMILSPIIIFIFWMLVGTILPK